MRPVSITTPAAFVFLAVLIAFVIRVWFAYDTVFGGSFVRFAETDPWYHMRLVENLLHHFPRRIPYDPYMLFGNGQNVAVAPLFDLIVASAALVLGLGAPSPWLVEHVGAVMPAVLGALCVLPAYGLGRTLFSTSAGLFAAGLIAILPGQFLARSSLGFTDHHVAEVLLSACALLCVAQGRTILAGIFLGAYLVNWAGGVMLVVVIVTAIAASLAFDRAHQPSNRVATAFGIAALIVAPFVLSWPAAITQIVVLAVGSAAVLAANALTVVLDRRDRPRWLIVPAAIAALAIAWLIVEIAAPVSAGLVRGYLARLSTSIGPRIAEAMPLFSFPVPAPLLVFVEFGVTLYLALAAAPFIARRLDAGRVLLLVMFAAALALTIQQVRFSYYLAIPVAVFAGYACDRLLDAAGKRRELVFLVLIVIVFLPNAQLVRVFATPTSGPNDDWHEALTWLRTNSPEPLGNPDAFNRDYAGMDETEGHRYPFPATAYGVAVSWDRGYWVTRIAHRIPSANPTQTGVLRVANVWLAPDEAKGLDAIDRLHARYLIVDDTFAPRWLARRNIMTGVIHDAIVLLGRDPKTYYEVYERRQPDRSSEPVLLFYPDYYQTLAARLVATAGGAARPRIVSVAVFHDEGSRRILDELKPFPSAAAAAAFVGEAPASRRLAGTDPQVSCVPLEAVQGLTSVHRSSPAGTVLIFERRR